MQATVSVTRYGETDELLARCLRSLALQKGAKLDILVLDQRRSKKAKDLCNELSTEQVRLTYQSIKAISLSYARNYGIKHAKTDIVLFCDTDCELPPSWAEIIIKVFAKRKAAIVGTKISPEWSRKPHWYHGSKFILEFYSMLDLGSKEQAVQKVIGASFAINKRVLGKEAYFSENLGRVNGVLLGGEETDLCTRAIQHGEHIYYTPRTYASHLVEPERIRLRWLLKRAYYGGVSRARKGGKPSANNAASKKKTIDYFALMLITPPYLLGYLLHKGDVPS